MSLTQDSEYFFATGAELPHGYNSDGFRGKNFVDIDMDNYLLFAGSSHTEGIGVKADETFAHLVSAELKCDHVNLGVGGGGIDAVEHNLLMWFLKHKKLPKAIIVEWPDYARFVQHKWAETRNSLCPAGMWSDAEFITYANDSLYIKGEMTYHFLHRIMPVKIIDVMHGKITNFPINARMIWHSEVDKGTDKEHAGPKTHKQTAENIIHAIDR